MDHSEAVAQFVAFTGADEAIALSMLEATGFQLEAAVNLFFAAGPSAAPGGAPHADIPPFEDDEALARRLQQEANATSAPMEEEVRAPLKVYKTERLVGDDAPYRPQQRRRPANPVPQNVVDAFRDFSGGAAAAGPSAGSGGAGPSLAAMYEPPREMLFQGSFEEAKEAAAQQGRWLIVNLQSTSQFASHRLNRDTWRNEMVRSLVEANFVLFQAYDMVEEGQKLQHFYKLYDIPAILILDPVTGAPMRQWTDFVDAERLTEELLPFLEHDIHDPAAARLARRARSRRDVPGGEQASGKTLTEDEELQRALQMSMADAAGRGGGVSGGSSGLGSGSGLDSGLGSGEGTDLGEAGEDEEEVPAAAAGGGAAAPAARSAAEVQAEAAARVPEEPSDGSGCRIAVRLPDGRRAQRRFPAGAPLAAVYDFCVSQTEEAAAGRQFTLSQGFPGAPALEDQQQTVEASGLHGAMLVLKWKD